MDMNAELRRRIKAGTATLGAEADDDTGTGEDETKPTTGRLHAGAMNAGPGTYPDSAPTLDDALRSDFRAVRRGYRMEGE